MQDDDNSALEKSKTCFREPNVVSYSIIPFQQHYFQTNFLIQSKFGTQ